MIEHLLDTKGMEKLSAALGKRVDRQMLRYYARRGDLPHIMIADRMVAETKDFVEFLDKLKNGPFRKVGPKVKR